jgi:hypothetical protein
MLLALAVLVPACALAQSQPPDPADPKAAVPPLRFESAIPRARPAEPKVADWKRVNEEVGRLGGHAGHLKALEGQAPAATGTKPAEPAKASGSGHSHKH